ncbi:helix-turn-helix transcriptional regulator, partial [Ideonella sp.]|uniref:helix-turn-helix transcriptional regulator n=1 Tax=Ideonella sp. TaxID=1929293 RepID=UPI003BB631DA
EQACLAGLIGQLGDAAFAQGGLDSLNHAVRAGSWSVYRLRPAKAPLLHLSAARGVADTTRDCFAAYVGGLYRRDASFDLVRRHPQAGQALVLKMGADEAPTPEHREAIYQRFGVLERLSVAQLEGDGSLLAVNLYRHGSQGAFDPLEQERFVRLAPLLLASVRRHLQLSGEPLPAQIDGQVADAARSRLQLHCQALTERELDVCVRLLRGWSFDGIAADMGLSVATVKTYRARAFQRLGLHFRSELFALLQRLSGLH